MRIKYTYILLLCVISFYANAQYSRLMNFDPPINGGKPKAGLYFDGTYLYGTTSFAFPSGGSIFKIKPDGTGFDTLMTFSASGAADCSATLISDGTYLYSITKGAGLYGAGSIFKIKPDGTGYAVLHNFGSGSDGQTPMGSLYYDGTYLYGTASGGGSDILGTLYKILPDGTGYTTLIDFTGPNGRNPIGGVISDGTFLYGMTSGGGITDSIAWGGYGLIYKIKPDGSAYDTVMNFIGPNGAIPESNLLFDGTFLYGTTGQGGSMNGGTVFKINPDGTGYSKLIDFVDTNGRGPSASLLLDGISLYGTTVLGGTDNVGVIYKIQTDGTGFFKMWDLSYAEGALPYSSLITDGTFLYGTATEGGTDLQGVVFKIGLETDIEEISESPIAVYPNPFTSEIILSSKTSYSDLSVIIYNSLGQSVYTSTLNLYGQIKVDLPPFEKGMYFLQINSGSRNILSQKLIK
ncbi:MAG: T9SS type A sorting domain-containing protein [Bacteroidetes bacterium]|nr:T9SS type A sorting domain-containing protein [Bacteroidota bacterium]